MLDDQTVRGTNFTCVHAGPTEGWEQFHLEPPKAPIAMRGKIFLRSLLESAGMEMSLNSVPPGKGMPIQHKHELNEEVYVVVGGQGQFLVDGQCIDVREGSVLRISPPAARTYRNTSHEPFRFLCIQYRANSTIEGRGTDGRKVEALACWPN